MKTDTLTREEMAAIINAQENLIQELRVNWLVDVSEPGNKEPLRAWLAMYQKPFNKQWLLNNSASLTGKHSLHPEKVDIDLLISALEKVNGS